MENDIFSQAIKELEKKLTKEEVEIKREREEKALFYEKNFLKIKPGMVVKGVVVGKSKDGILISIGLKEEGVVPFSELSLKAFKNPDEVVNIQDEIEAIVLSTNNGNFVLSKKRAELKNILDRINKAFINNETMNGIVSSQVRGGLLVDLGVPGFIPASHIKKEAIRNLDSYVGKEVRFKVIEFDRKKREIVLSLKKVEEDEAKERKEKIFNNLREGEIVRGKVIKLTDFGVFVDIGGLEGLVPISEISYKKVKHPESVLKNGEMVSVSVMKVDRENQRVSFSLKNAYPSPWEDIEKRLNVGSIVTGRVSKVMPTYAFITIDDVEGFLPKSQMNDEVLKEDQEVDVKIIELNPKKERIVLSLKGLKKDEKIEKFLAKEKKGGIKLGEILQSKYKRQRRNDKYSKHSKRWLEEEW